MRVTTRAEDPKRNDDADETSHMEAEDQTLDHGEMLDQDGVEKGDKENNGNNQKSPMPALVHVVVVIQDNKTLDLGCRQKAPDGAATLPPQCTQPADHKGQELLLASRSKFGDPMILATWGWGKLALTWPELRVM